MGGFPQVKITSFQLPADDPNGGIQVELGTKLTSPSPISVQLGTIRLAIAYDGVNLGQVASENITLQEGDNDILLKGTLVPQTDPDSLTKVGNLFTNYVSGKTSNTTATGISAAPNGNDNIGWLSQGFQSVQLHVGLGAGAPLDIIKSVKLGYIDLGFNSQTPYAPSLTAPSVVAGFQIPFGFSLNIYQVAQNLYMGNNGTGNFASISAPFVDSQCNQQAGTLGFPMNNDLIKVVDGQESMFDDYTYSLTAQETYSFQVRGEATTKVTTPIGNLTMGGIMLNVPTSLQGMQWLNNTPTVIHSIDVYGGTQQYMELSINTTMGNPSDFSISIGDVHFDMQSGGVSLGSILLNNLTMQRGSNNVIALATFDPKSSSTGQNLLSTFVMGQNNSVQIKGFDQTTAIKSLSKGLSQISIGSTLPGLPNPLIQSTKLTVLDNSIQTSVVDVQVTIANPFTCPLGITSVKSAATYNGMPVGNIDQNTNINVPGHASVLSQSLQMKMNLEPAAVALLLRDLAVKANLDTRPLDALLGMGGFHVQGQQSVSADPSLFENFNVSEYTMTAMKKLTVDLQLASGTTMGDYVNTMQFAQSNVTTQTDETVTKLIPVVGQPIVQQIVDGSNLSFETITLSNPTDSSFTVQMVGAINNTGPMSAAISFPTPLTVAWEGTVLGQVSMPTINTQPNVGAKFNVTGGFTIADQNVMGNFSAYLINSENFVWNIYTNSVAVDAIGYNFTNISMNKFVTLDGAQGFKDCVQIPGFDLPSNDPAGGITLTMQSIIKNPSQIGFSLGGAGFASFFDDQQIAELASNGPAIFPAKGSNLINMKGRLIPQTTDEGLKAITEVFENYLNAMNSSLTVKGVSGSGANGQVGWLTTGFKSINIANVSLPGPAQKPELIPAITMKQLEMDFTKDPYAPIMSSEDVEAQLKNPFGFPLGVSSLNMDVESSYENKSTATLKVPDVPSTTNLQTELVTTAFKDLPFNVLDNAHETFNQFVKALTSTANVTFGLAGEANSVAETAVGQLQLKNISYDVQSPLAGKLIFSLPAILVMTH